MMKPCSSSALLSLLLLGCLLAASEAAVFTCNATTTTTCQSIIGYLSTNASTYGDISSLFQVAMSSIISQNNLSSATVTYSTVVSAGSIVDVPIPCICANGTGWSEKKPIYTIQPGDTLDAIARNKFDQFVNYTEIASANNILNPDNIEAGKTLYIPLPCSCDPVDRQKVQHLAYMVQSGNTVAGIAEKYGTTESTLLELNGISNPKKLEAGQILDVPLGLNGVGINPQQSAGSQSKSKRTITISIVVVSVVASLAAIGLCFWRRRRSVHKDGDEDDIMALQENIETELQYILNPNAEYQVYNFTTLKIATKNFSDMNKLGKGGFGPVYKGILLGGQELAVKRLSGSLAQGITEFKNEVDFLAKLRHKNLVQLLGCCIQNKEKLLCYEYLPNGSLDKILFEKDASTKVSLDWKMRQRIIEGITRGLHYLHEESRLKIIHRDLKVSNILLDKDMNAKISDFGLARFFEEDQTQKDTNVIAGTFGYMAPEYILRGNFSAKSDVYSFGILLLEIVTGQKNSSFVGSDRASSLIDHACIHCKEDNIS